MTSSKTSNVVQQEGHLSLIDGESEKQRQTERNDDRQRETSTSSESKRQTHKMCFGDDLSQQPSVGKRAPKRHRYSSHLGSTSQNGFASKEKHTASTTTSATAIIVNKVAQHSRCWIEKTISSFSSRQLAPRCVESTHDVDWVGIVVKLDGVISSMPLAVFYKLSRLVGKSPLWHPPSLSPHEVIFAATPCKFLWSLSMSDSMPSRYEFCPTQSPILHPCSQRYFQTAPKA